MSTVNKEAERMKSFDYQVTDQMGLHARPAGMLVKEAGKFSSVIKVTSGGKSAEATRLFGIMGLAVKCGATVTVTAEGADEEAAIAAMEAFFKENV